MRVAWMESNGGWRRDVPGTGPGRRRPHEIKREPRVMYSPTPPSAEGFLLWVDAVGGYRVCLDDQVTLGQPAAAAEVDIPILGDLSVRHARIRRDGEGYLVEAIREVYVDGRAVDHVAALADGCCLRLGDSVELVFRRPHALSATARLDFGSRHRTAPTTDGIILMAEACILGPRPHDHVVCRRWPGEVILYRQDDALFCRSEMGGLTIDGVSRPGRGPITRRSRIAGDRFSMSLEPL